jgi:hypothetical protein
MRVPKYPLLIPTLVLLNSCSSEPALRNRNLPGGGEIIRPSYNMVVGASEGSRDGDYYYKFSTIGEQLIIYDVNPESFGGRLVCIDRGRDLRAFQLKGGIPYLSNSPITPLECDEMMKNLESRGLTSLQSYYPSSIFFVSAA